MGRPSKLSEKQWADIQRRLLGGEKAADLAREFKISKATISARFSNRIETVKTVANQILETERAVRSLPIAEQIAVFSLADELRAISSHLASAGKYGAATAHRLSGIAHAKVQEIDDADPFKSESMESLKGVAVLTRMANEASRIPIDLLAANRDTVKELNQQQRPTPQRITVVVEDASEPDAEAQ